MFVTFYFILVFSAAIVKSIKKSYWSSVEKVICTIIPSVREEGNRPWSCFMLLKNTWINPNISSKLNWRSGIEEETQSCFIPCRLEIRVNHSSLVTPATDTWPALEWHLAMFSPARAEAVIPLAEGIGVLVHLLAAGAWLQQCCMENTATALSIREMNHGEELKVPTAKRLIEIIIFKNVIYCFFK